MRELFLDYITDIKKKAQRDIFSVINVTLISNPYITSFPKKFILKENIYLEPEDIISVIEEDF